MDKLSKITFIFAVIVAAIFMTACSNTASDSPQTSDPDPVSANSLYSSEYEQMLENTPPQKREELLKRREINLKMAKYLRLEGRRYYLDINEEDASKLGVSSEWYRIIKKEIDDVNSSIEKMEAEGQKIDLPDPQVLMGNK